MYGTVYCLFARPVRTDKPAILVDTAESPRCMGEHNKRYWYHVMAFLVVWGEVVKGGYYHSAGGFQLVSRVSGYAVQICMYQDISKRGWHCDWFDDRKTEPPIGSIPCCLSSPLTAVETNENFSGASPRGSFSFFPSTSQG